MNRFLILLSSALLSLTAYGQVEAGKTYHIISKKYSGMYMGEEADGTMTVASESSTRREYWTFETADAEKGTFYVRNEASGNYIQSCNKTPSSASIMKTGAAPVEYYIGKSASGANEGYYWLSSTDCENYSDNTQIPRGLNKDGASNNIIVWNAGLTNDGSYWIIQETEFDYEIKPFVPSEDEDHLKAGYHIVSPDRTYLAPDRTWQSAAETDALTFYFIGTANKTGYKIYNAVSKSCIKTAADEELWRVTTGDIGADGHLCYAFVALDNSEDTLKVDGVSQVLFKSARSAFQLSSQVYLYPCGAKTGQYFSKVSLRGAAASHPLTYPIRYKTAAASTQQTVTPTTWYTINTMDFPVLRRGLSAELQLTLQKTPAAGETAYVYFDWNRDGVFEVAEELEIAKTMTTTVSVPAEASLGKTRMRLRVTGNGLPDAEDEVAGQTLDFVMNVVEYAEGFQATVSVNDTLRGKAELRETEAEATPIGDALFVCWKEGNNVLSSKKIYEFTLDHDVHLTAYFSADKSNPYGEPVVDGVNDRLKYFDRNELIDISVNDRLLEAKSSSAVARMMLFDLNGRLVKEAKGNRLSIAGIPPASYVVKVFTRDHDKALKVILK